MENRGIFTLDGITGMLIATVLLLSMGVQQENASNFYKIENEKDIKMFSTENAAHRVSAE